jgi:tetratricopeptide (TPR) repeat protein
MTASARDRLEAAAACLIAAFAAAPALANFPTAELSMSLNQGDATDAPISPDRHAAPRLGAFAQGATAPAPGLSSAWPQCRGGPGISADAQISGCTAIIESGGETNENLAEALQIRCQVLSERGERDAAIRDCDRAIELKPDSTDAYFKRATAYLNKGDADRAIADYTQTIRLKPDSVGAFTLRGMAYAHKGDYDRAIADYTHALQLYPGFGMAEGGLAEAKAAKAKMSGGQALGDPRAWCSGKALPQEGFAQDLQISGCTTLIQSGKEKRADLATDFFNRASAYDFQGNPDRAIPDFDQAIKLAPKNADAYYRRGAIYWLKADYDRAIADFTRAIKANPKQVLYFSYRGYAHYAKGQFDLAIRDYDQAIKLQPDNADAFLNRSLAENGNADYERAISDSDQAIKLSRTSEATVGYDSRGDAHFHKGDFATAIDDYDHALKLWPEYPQALYGRGAAKMRSGDRIGGQADMDAARKLKPGVENVEGKLGIKP